MIKLAISCFIFGFLSIFTQKITAQSTEVIYKMTEQAPIPKGGLSTFYNYTEDNIKRTPIAKQKGIKGQVFVQFVVEKDGALSNIKVIKGIGAGCDEEVIKCLKNAPRWQPGKQKGQPVRVQQTLAIAVR
ncbi:MAG: energy transducer TonB [Bacteroidetes bacterium]|nr:MAG: energy transducer TonB [Bacteroidota bacterium]TAG85467.1 MAG: energy transducer TonB [Bacteroidota bacterium]